VTKEHEGEREGLRGKFRDITKLGELLTLGLSIALSIVLGVFVGHYLVDGWFGTAPWGVIVFTIFGIVAGFLNLFRITRKYINKGE